MSLITMSSGSVYGIPLDVFLLDHMTRGFIDVHPESMTRSYHFHDKIDREKTSQITVVSRDQWFEFKDWCQDKGITVHLKKRVIDSNKTWWPSVVEILPDDDNNDHLVWVKLKYY